MRLFWVFTNSGDRDGGCQVIRTRLGVKRVFGFMGIEDRPAAFVALLV